MRKLTIICISLVVIILAVYLQTGNHEFLGYDDPAYVTGNPHVSSGITGNNIRWAFTSVDEYNWHPITWVSHMTDVQLFGMNPRGHHLGNVMFHSVASVLLLVLLFRTTGSLWQSSFVAALFALHPLHVESVAWVAERKDVLSALFWFLTLLLYAEYAAKKTTARYLSVLLSFVLGLMSKPMLVSLPLVMLLMDYWPLNRFGHEHVRTQLSGRVMALIKEKIPFFACSILSGIITIYAQHNGGATRGLDEIPFVLRMENALIAYVKYIINTFWPHDLAVLYPIPSSYPLWQVICSLLVLLLLSVAVIRFGRRFPYLPVGWFWFVITLIPVIGLLQVGSQSMADRYMYIPMTGILIMVAWGTPDLLKKLQHRETILALLVGAVIVASVALTWHQLGYWKDSITLYRHTLHVTRGNFLIHDNLGIELVESGDLDAGMQELHEALRINPNLASGHFNLGIAFDRKGDLDSAIHEYQESLRIAPKAKKVHNNLGIAFARKGELDAAIDIFQEALLINSHDAKAHENLGIALEQKRMQATNSPGRGKE